MFYIHHATCISPQQTFMDPAIEILHESADNKLHVIEPDYPGIPPGMLRRMGKAVRIGVGAALPFFKNNATIDGIIMGTANGGMEDCIKFLNQIIEYEEGMLTPGNFVQSTPNAIASQISMLSSNKAYNITHVHRGLAFENAMIDADMLIREHPGRHFLLEAVDEISAYNYNIDWLDGWYKKEPVSNHLLYATDSPGSLAGEGAAAFLANGSPAGALATVQAIHTLHTEDESRVKDQLQHFLKQQLSLNGKIDLLLSGENGDNRLLKYYTACESLIDDDAAIARFKHMSGEHPTASAFAVWLACYLIRKHNLPDHMIKRMSAHKEYRKILIYNNHKGIQHSFILISI